MGGVCIIRVLYKCIIQNLWIKYTQSFLPEKLTISQNTHVGDWSDIYGGYGGLSDPSDLSILSTYTVPTARLNHTEKIYRYSSSYCKSTGQVWRPPSPSETRQLDRRQRFPSFPPNPYTYLQFLRVDHRKKAEKSRIFFPVYGIYMICTGLIQKWPKQFPLYLTSSKIKTHLIFYWGLNMCK